jgi:hypothetical protein
VIGHCWPVDLILLSNFIQSSTSLRQAETWTPVCFPKFRADGMLHAFVSCVGTVVSSMKPTVSAAARDARGSPSPAIARRTPADPETSGVDFMSPGSSATAAYLSSSSAAPDKASTRHHTGIFLVLVSANTTPTHLTELARGKAAVVSELSTGPLLREIARSLGRKRFTAGNASLFGLCHERRINMFGFFPCQVSLKLMAYCISCTWQRTRSSTQCPRFLRRLRARSREKGSFQHSLWSYGHNPRVCLNFQVAAVVC